MTTVRLGNSMLGAMLALIAGILVVYPIVQLLLETVIGGDRTADSFLLPYREAFASPVALSAIWGTIWLTASSLLFGVPLAIMLAWITSSTDAPLGKFLSMLPTLALALSPLVGAIGWLILLSPRVGLLNLLARRIFGLDGPVGPFDAYSLTVIVMLMTFYIVPYIYGPVHTAFLRLDSSLTEAARICGADQKSVLLSVLLPVLRPSILAGALIAGVMAAAMFAIPLVLSSGTGLRVIPTQIYQYINQQGRPAPAMAMASLLMVSAGIAMLLYFRLLGRARFVTVSGKGSRSTRTRLGRWKWLATGFVLLYLFLALILPLGTLSYLSLVGFWSSNVFEQAISLEQYRQLIEFPRAVKGIVNSAWLSAIAAAGAVTIGLLVSYRRLRWPTAANRAIALSSSLPLGVPSIVLGLAFLMAFTGGLLPLYGTALILIFAYFVHVLPICVRNCDASLLQIAPELEEAGLVCGDNRAGILRRILVPIVGRSLVGVWGLSFIILFRDVSISVLLFTQSTIPSSVALLSIFEQGWITGAAAYSILITVFSALVVVLVVRNSEE